jgi:hypothetical protein
MPTFSDLLHRRDFRRIAVLKLDRCCGLDLQTLFSGIPAVKQLSLNECSLEISTILSLLTGIASGAVPSSLESLSISGNLATAPIGPNMVLPRRLARVHADEVEWSGDTFTAFWEVVFRATPLGPLEISVAGGRQTRDQWTRFWTFFAGARMDHVTSLNWGCCPVSAVFFAVIGRLKKLAALGISGCLTKSDPLLPELI